MAVDIGHHIEHHVYEVSTYHRLCVEAGSVGDPYL
jgi:hypothetical protein